MRNLSNDQNLPRDFKGIWIPREIWTHQELNCFEKSLWAEIDSLDRQEEGCTASNLYFCKFFNVSERVLQGALSRLKKLGLIKQEKFDGRTRVLRSSLKTTYEKFNTPEVKKSSPLPCENLHLSPIGDSIERENKEENKDNNPPLPPHPKKHHSLKPPTKEEEEEIEKRLKERPPNAPKIVSKKKWMESVLEDIRSENKAKEEVSERSHRHRAQIIPYDMKLLNGRNVCCLKDRVELTHGSYCCILRYDASDEEWEAKTGLKAHCNSKKI